MDSSPRFHHSPAFLGLSCLILISIACGIPLVPAPTPTATLPPEVDSALRAKLLGQWQVVSGGAWEGATLTFNEDGSFTITGGSQEKDNTGSFFFTAKSTIAFSFPDYQGFADIQFMNDDKINLFIRTADLSRGMFYSVERLK